MLVYIVVAVLLFIGTIAKQSKSLFWISFIYLFCITAFRNPNLGGTDAIIYQSFFDDIPGILNLSGYESKYSIGYTFINSIVKQISDNYIVFQIFYTLITFLLLYYLLKKLELNYKEKCLFLLSYFSFRFIWNEWIILRQNLADLFFWIILIELYDLLDKKSKTIHFYYLKVFCLIAASIAFPALFHTSAYFNIAMIPCLLLFRKINLRYKFLITVILSVIFLIGSQAVFSTLFSYASLIDNRYDMYASNFDTSQNLINTFVKYAFLSLFTWHYSKENFRRKKIIYDTMAITCILSSINVEVMTRVYEYYAVGFYTIMALFLHNFSNKRILVAFLFFVGLMVILVRFLFIFNDGLFLNYRLGF